jgi:anti-sigma B factor antagonist
MPVSIELEQGPEFWTLTLAGDLDYGDCSMLRMHIDRILKAVPPAVVADLSGLDYLDSSGLGLLLSLSREYTAQGGWLVLVSNATVDGILRMTRLTGIFTIASSVAEAAEWLADTRTAVLHPGAQVRGARRPSAAS